MHELPLNGRHVLDLALLAPGSVTPPQNGFSTTPNRGLGAVAILSAGNRGETTNFLVNGVTLNNLAFNSILFQPSISSIDSFKLDNSTFSAEYGQSAGSIVNIATRSGTNALEGELFEFFRNDRLDARNFFEFNSSDPAPFNRHQFGGHVGGPIVKGRTFFFASYERVNQEQQLALNTVVLSDAQRASVSDPLIARLLALVPRQNLVDAGGFSRFAGTADAAVTSQTVAVDVAHTISASGRLHGYFAANPLEAREPTARGKRADIFDLFNHPNFGQPGNVVGSPTFGRIINTRFATGESGSSRQIQLAARVLF